VQRLFGVSLALSREELLDAESQRRCAREVQTALGDLQTALRRPLGHTPRPTAVTFAEALERVRALHPELEIGLERGTAAAVPSHLEAVAQSILVEAVRNAHKHAHARSVGVSLGNDEGTFVMEVRNDGAGRHNGAGGGVGLRLATLEALQHGGVLEFGQSAPGSWQVRLVIPTIGQ
jgi:signal transduction histidine kinase